MAIRFTIPGAFNNPDLPILDLAGFVDTFTRTDAATLGTTETPPRPWVVEPAATVQGVTGNAGYAARSGSLGPTIAHAEAAIADGTIDMTMGTFTSGWVGIAFRAASITNYWRFVTSGALCRLESVIDGTTAIVGTYTQAVADGDTLTVALSGSSIAAKVNGATVGTTTSTALQDVTSHGIYNAGPATNLIRDIAVTA